MKSVIFIGGTSYSGSTLFDMILANDPRGFSCGELHALFRPVRKHHQSPECGCGNSDCTVWTKVKENGEAYAYESIFDLFPDINYIVDSSKNPFWIQGQAFRLMKAGVSVKHILIWKSPSEMAASCKKRGHERSWARKWVNYHRLYMSLVPEITACPYKSLVTDPTALRWVCRHLGISYFDDKKYYWEKKHHTLFGNTSAKIHTRRVDDDRYQEDQAHLENRTNSAPDQLRRAHRTIHYTGPDESGMTEYESNKARIESILRVLELAEPGPKTGSGLSPASAPFQGIRLGRLELLIRQLANMPLAYRLRRHMNRLRS